MSHKQTHAISSFSLCTRLDQDDQCRPSRAMNRNTLEELPSLENQPSHHQMVLVCYGPCAQVVQLNNWLKLRLRWCWQWQQPSPSSLPSARKNFSFASLPKLVMLKKEIKERHSIINILPCMYVYLAENPSISGQGFQSVSSVPLVLPFLFLLIIWGNPSAFSPLLLSSLRIVGNLWL